MVLAATGMVGCEEYLDKQPQSAFPDSPSFWSGESALELETNYFYAEFAGASYGSAHNGGFYAESMCDDYGQGGYSEFSASIPSGSGVWGASYQEIRRANIILARMQSMNLSDEARKHYEGFARFYRAMQHFDIVKSYGDCVWVDTEVDINDSTALTQHRADRAEVMKKVCEDLKFAGENCREGNNRVFGKYVAWAFLSRAALFEGTWQKYHKNNNAEAEYFFKIAKEAAEKVMQSGKYQIQDKYGANYISLELNSNPEMILFCQFIYGSDIKKGHGLHGYSTSSTAIWGLTKSAVEAYPNSDGLPIHVSPLGYDDSTVKSAVRGRDARLTHNVCDTVLMVNTYAWHNGMNATTAYWTTKFVSWNDLWNSSNNLAPYNDTDGPVYMYSEVLLNYAEACAELGQLDQSAMDRSINILRQKHGHIPALTVAGSTVSVNGTTITKDPKNTFGVSDLIWEVRRERRCELMCDGFRYNDLRRWKMGELLDFSKNPDGFVGARVDALKAYFDETHNGDGIHDANAKFEDVKNGIYVYTVDGKEYVSAFNVPKNNRVFDPNKHYLSPLPSSVTLLNPNLLPNNPGWE